ncbi:MAG TPA: hypothetical protein VET65_00435 [Candidatus Limnocylindrales bacterium]|nr:hypothetical protein [Candidatus Limnocylindrales bacterium]
MEPRIDECPIDVLFIEQDRDVSDMYRLKLELDGYRVRVVRSGEALAAATHRAPDLVFLDLQRDHPEMIGVLHRLRASTGRAQLPAIVLADRSEAELRGHGITLGPCDYAVRVGPVRSLSEVWPIGA